MTAGENRRARARLDSPLSTFDVRTQRPLGLDAADGNAVGCADKGFPFAALLILQNAQTALATERLIVTDLSQRGIIERYEKRRFLG